MKLVTFKYPKLDFPAECVAAEVGTNDALGGDWGVGETGLVPTEPMWRPQIHKGKLSFGNCLFSIELYS